MSATHIMANYAETQGWATETQLDLALEYIEQQQSNAAFEDFLAQAAERERLLGAPKQACYTCLYDECCPVLQGDECPEEG